MRLAAFYSQGGLYPIQKVGQFINCGSRSIVIWEQNCYSFEAETQVLQLLHLGHFGMQRMKQLARSSAYWPDMNSNIEDMCRSCTSCAEHQNDPPKQSDHPWMVPEKPWSRIHIDHAINFLGTNWLIVVDAFSKYPCIHSTASITSKATMDLLEKDFAHFGYPHSFRYPSFR